MPVDEHPVLQESLLAPGLGQLGAGAQRWGVGAKAGLQVYHGGAACRLTGAIRHFSPETQTLSYCHALIPSSLS